MPEEINKERNRFITQLKLTALEYASVIMSGMSILIAAFALLFGGLAAYIAVDAKQASHRAEEQNKIYEIYINNLTAELKAKGFEAPPIPENQEDEE
jgi:adenylosuccinate lyase